MASLVLKREGHSVYAKPALNTAGIVYVAFVIVYTGLLLYGLGVLWLHRQKPAVRIRGFAITAAAVLSIHAYVAALFIVYPLNGAFKCTTEFWYMNTVFPLGIALFQASNMRLWAYAKAQQRFTKTEGAGEAQQPFKLSLQGARKWVQHMSVLKKTYFFIAVGLFVQLILTFILYYGSRRFSPSTGFFGVHTNPLACRRGFEWIPSVLWQCFWAWIFGPLVLFKTRHIKDTHFWAIQTRLAVIACLPGAPLWLAFLYGTGPILTAIDEWWPPAMWFAPGLMAMQITAIIFPGYDIYRHKKQMRPKSPDTSVSSISSVATGSSSGKSKELAISLVAFEHQLKHDLLPLLEFSAEKDFTSENVIFLRDVRNFKLKWRRHIILAPTIRSSLSSKNLRAMYEDAARIYFELVCPGTATFPVNLDSRMYYDLSQMFQTLKYKPPVIPVERKRNTKRNLSTASQQAKESTRKAIAPWDSPPSKEMPEMPQVAVTQTKDSSSSETALIDIMIDDQESPGLVALPPPAFQDSKLNTPETSTSIVKLEGPSNNRDLGDMKNTFSVEEIDQDPSHAIPKGKILNKHRAIPHSADFVPSAFGLDVFDAAYEAVKYLVYTNTWKSFVLTLDEFGIERLAAFLTRPVGLVPRRGLYGTTCGKWSHMTDVEMYNLNHELQMERENAADPRFHHGVLDVEAGPVPIDDCDARCRACRSKFERKVERIVRQAGFNTADDV